MPEYKAMLSSAIFSWSAWMNEIQCFSYPILYSITSQCSSRTLVLYCTRVRSHDDVALRLLDTDNGT